MKHSDPAQYYLKVLALPLLLIAAWPLFMGIRLVYQPNALRQEAFPSTLPTEGPYTAEELRRAESRAKSLVPLDKLKEGFTSQELESLADDERKLRILQQAAWKRHQTQQIDRATHGQPLGWGLIGLSGALMILWSWVGWRLWTAR
ncbi:MAG TPA: hypothetical protein VHP11_18165 [Tepidisphaeraceae bacterium]|nr:hypothetical protein [Tepidisphaeraceae bacterium]